MDLAIQQSSQAKRRRLAPHAPEESSHLDRHPLRIVALAAHIFAYCPIAEWGRSSRVNKVSHLATRQAMAARARALGVGPRGEGLDLHCEGLKALWSELPVFLPALPDAAQRNAGTQGPDREEALRRLRALPSAQLLSILQGLPTLQSPVEHVKTSLLASCHAQQGIDLTPPPLSLKDPSLARQRLNPFNIRDLAQEIFSYCSVQQWGLSTSLSKTVHSAILLAMAARARSIGIGAPGQPLDVQCARFRLLWLQIPLFLSRIARGNDPGVPNNDRWGALQELRALPLPQFLELLARTHLSMYTYCQLNDVKHVEAILLSAPHAGEAAPSLLQWVWTWRGMRDAGNKRAEEVGRFLLDHGLFQGMSREQIQEYIRIDHVSSHRLVRLLLDRRYINANIWVHRHSMWNDTVPLLHAAVGLGALATVQLLLQRNANPARTDWVGRNALFYVRPEHKDGGEIMNLLVKAGAPIKSAVNNKLLHVLLKAHQYRSQRAIDIFPIETLLWRGANPHIETPQGRTALFFFPYEPYLSLFKTYGANINHRDHKGRTSLAIQAGNLWRRDSQDTDASEVSVDFVGIEGSRSRVFWGGSADGSEVLDLLKCGANPNIADHEGNTPLFFATEQREIEHLLYYGADVHRINNMGMNVLHYHVGKWSQTTHHILPLLRRGARLDLFDQQGFTPLHRAIWHGHFNYVKELLLHRANPNTPTLTEGFTPLHLAVRDRASGLVELLLNNGANPFQTDFSGRIPCDLVYIRPRGRRSCSRIREEEKITTLLKPHGAVAQPMALTKDSCS